MQYSKLQMPNFFPRQNLSMKLDMHINDTMVQHPSKFGGMSMKTGWVRNYVWRRNNGQKYGTADSSHAIFWFAPSPEFGYETWVWMSTILWSNIHPNFGGMSTKTGWVSNYVWKWRNNGQIMVQQIPRLWYCDSLPHQNLAMKLDMHVNNTIIQHPSKFSGMSMKTGWVRNNVWTWRNNGQKHSTSTAAPSSVILWFSPSPEFGLASTSKTPWSKIHPNLVAWAWKQVELEIMFESR